MESKTASTSTIPQRLAEISADPPPKQQPYIPQQIPSGLQTFTPLCVSGSHCGSGSNTTPVTSPQLMQTVEQPTNVPSGRITSTSHKYPNRRAAIEGVVCAALVCAVAIVALNVYLYKKNLPDTTIISWTVSTVSSSTWSYTISSAQGIDTTFQRLCEVARALTIAACGLCVASAATVSWAFCSSSDLVIKRRLLNLQKFEILLAGFLLLGATGTSMATYTGPDDSRGSTKMGPAGFLFCIAGIAAVLLSIRFGQVLRSYELESSA